MVSNMSETQTKRRYGVDPKVVDQIHTLQAKLESEFGFEMRFIRIMNMLLQEALDARRAAQDGSGSTHKD